MEVFNLFFIIVFQEVFASVSKFRFSFFQIWVFSNFISFKNNLRLTRYENCPGVQPITFQLIFNTSDVEGQTQFSGVLDVRKNVSGSLELAIEACYCITTKTCVKLPSQVVLDACHHLNDPKAFFAGFINSIQPKFECPFKAGRYVVPKATVNLSSFSFVPILASTWTMTIKLLSVIGSQKILAFCSIIEYKVAANTKNRKRQRRRAA